ncbi:MAG TPA: hypothetical protein VK563_08395 [Puia sp.]|nr:hypothetical protein [Puia sp.]
MQHIIRHLFNASSLEEVPRERLEEFVQEYPSFSIGHYLLSTKLHAEGAANFTEETQKTNLYFSNPFWLQWLLQNTVKTDSLTRGWPVRSPATDQSLETDRSEEAFEKLAPAERTELAEEQEPVIRAATEEGYVNAEELERIEEAGVEEPGVEVTEEAFVQVGEPAAETETHVAAEASEMEENVQPASVHEEAQPEPSEKLESSADILLRNILEARSLRQSLHRINQRIADPTPSPEPPQEEAAKDEAQTEEVQTEKATQEEAPTEEVQTEEATQEEASMEEAHKQEASKEEYLTEDARTEEAKQEEPKQEEPAYEGTPQEEVRNEWVPQEDAKQEAPLREEIPHDDIRREEQRQEEPVAEMGNETHAIHEQVVEAPVFESFHTVDYFASQGIKLSLDENPNDRLGKQMKSFTDWLKVMKRIPQKEAGIIPDLAAEHQVQAIAAHSIEGKEVVTETMAEVLAKQGMREKATEVYRKLSLLNPGKSAYFAARIEQLKTI